MMTEQHDQTEEPAPEPVTADDGRGLSRAGEASRETQTGETPRETRTGRKSEPHPTVRAFRPDETGEDTSESATDVVKKALRGDRDTLIAAAITAGIYAACLGITYAVRYCATKHAVKAALRELQKVR